MDKAKSTEKIDGVLAMVMVFDRAIRNEDSSGSVYVLFLGQKSEDATKNDIVVIDDLIDTLRANLEKCVGLAGNMIGVKKRILVFTAGNLIVPMINPVVLNKEKIYETEESCLSLIGFRKTKRYEKIEVEYLDRNFKKQKQVFAGFIAQIIQHEMDHFEGIII